MSELTMKVEAVKFIIDGVITSCDKRNKEQAVELAATEVELRKVTEKYHNEMVDKKNILADLEMARRGIDILTEEKAKLQGDLAWQTKNVQDLLRQVKQATDPDGLIEKQLKLESLTVLDAPEEEGVENGGAGNSRDTERPVQD